MCLHKSIIEIRHVLHIAWVYSYSINYACGGHEYDPLDVSTPMVMYVCSFFIYFYYKFQEYMSERTEDMYMGKRLSILLKIFR